MANKALIAAAAVVCVLYVQPAAAATMADGANICSMYGFPNLGTIEIKGGQFRGPAYDGKYGPYAGYDLMSEGVVAWGAPLGGFESGDSKLVSSVYHPAEGKNPAWFQLTLQTASGNFQSIDCQRES